MKYRMLKKGEIVQKGDELIAKTGPYNKRWLEVGSSIGKRVGEYTSLRFRRPIKSTRTKYEMEFRWFKRYCNPDGGICPWGIEDACNAKNCPAIKKLKPITPPKEVDK